MNSGSEKLKTNTVQISLKTVLLSDIINAISKAVSHPTEVLIKMDIEGSECNAFLGSAEVLTNQQSISIVAVIMEWTFHNWPDRCSAAKVLELKKMFLDARYIPFTFKNQKLVNLDVRQDWNTDVLWIKDYGIIHSICPTCNVSTIYYPYSSCQN